MKIAKLVLIGFLVSVPIREVWACIGNPEIQTKTAGKILVVLKHTFPGIEDFRKRLETAPNDDRIRKELMEEYEIRMKNSTPDFGDLPERLEKAGIRGGNAKSVMDFVSNGYNVIEQDDNEYVKFLAEAKNSNKDRPSDCPDYIAVARKAPWTGYMQTGKKCWRSNPSEKECSCMIPMCMAGNYNIKWNELK
jgi:hypothetical protein